MLNTWTDYPITEFGDEPGKMVSRRTCHVESYDGNKYVCCVIDNFAKEIKWPYVYTSLNRTSINPKLYKIVTFPLCGWRSS